MTQVSTNQYLPFSSIMQLVETVTTALPFALIDGEISAWDVVAINQIVTEHGRTRRGAAAVRNYLNERE